MIPVDLTELANGYRARRDQTRRALASLRMPSLVSDPLSCKPACGLGECFRCAEYTALAAVPPWVPGTPEGWYCGDCLRADLTELRRELARILQRRAHP